MKGFVYLKKREVPGICYVLSPKIAEKQAGECMVFTVPHAENISIYDRLLQKRIEKRAAGLPIITDWKLGTLPIYQPHKKLFYRELEAVIRKAGRRLGTDFFAHDMGIVCETLEEAEALLPRLHVPVLWVFCREEGVLREREEESPVFLSREVSNIARLPAVIALKETPALEQLSRKAVLFNLTDRDFVREYTVNDAWTRFPPQLVQTGIDKKTLNSVLYDLNQAEKVSSLRWG